MGRKVCRKEMKKTKIGRTKVLEVQNRINLRKEGNSKIKKTKINEDGDEDEGYTSKRERERGISV